MKHLEYAVPLRTFEPRHWLALLFGLVLATLLALPARAAEAPDPPDRAGRLAEVDGQVWIYATDSGEWIAATRNRPITTGDRLSTENDGRAELRVGSTVLRIAANTELEVVQLDDDHVSLQLHSGSMTARLRTRDAANQFDLATEEGRFRADRTGNYRFDRIDDTSSATALSGQVVYEGDGTALTVQQGQRAEFWKERGVAQYSLTDPKRDGFSDWVASRDSRDERSVSTRYVSAEMTGVEDLDRYGRWEPNSDYGPVWIPREVAPGWAPYRMGHWAWVSPWGWSWVDDAPWGFAPFHYGRWVWFRNNWCWTPGRYVARPVYAPALVAWVGGPNLSISISAGRAPTVGWFPLAPREVYVPGYHVSPHYVRNVNVTQVTNITNVNITTIINSPNRVMAETHYVNRGLPHAVTVVPTSVVERRQPVAPAITVVNDRVLRDMVRERPRADAPVAAPPRWAPGTRRIDDPRISRPGSPPNRGDAPNLAQPQQPRTPRPIGNVGNVGNAERPAPPVAGVAPAPRPQEPTRPQEPPRAQEPQRPQEPRERDRDRDRPGRGAPGVTVPTAPANTAPPVANAPPPQGVQPVVPTPAQRAIVRGGSTPPQQPPQRDGRVHNPEMPGPPRAAVQAPPAQQQTQQPRPQVTAPAPAPAPQVVRPQAPPPPAPRAPEAQKPEAQKPREAPRETARPQPDARQGARETRERGGEKER